MKDAKAKFPHLEGAAPGANLPNLQPVPPNLQIDDFANSHATLDAIKNDTQLTIIKTMTGKCPSYSLLVEAPKVADPDQKPDPKTYQL